jgi:hypothetical protein
VSPPPNDGILWRLATSNNLTGPVVFAATNNADGDRAFVLGLNRAFFTFCVRWRPHGKPARRRLGGFTMFHVLFATGWDHQADEPRGGRCLGTYDTLGEAVEASRRLFAPVGGGHGLAERSYGHGQVVVTDAEHHSVAVNGELLIPPERALALGYAEFSGLAPATVGRHPCPGGAPNPSARDWPGRARRRPPGRCVCGRPRRHLKPWCDGCARKRRQRYHAREAAQ